MRVLASPPRLILQWLHKMLTIVVFALCLCESDSRAAAAAALHVAFDVR